MEKGGKKRIKMHRKKEMLTKFLWEQFKFFFKQILHMYLLSLA